jgi:hypothetical protein
MWPGVRTPGCFSYTVVLPAVCVIIARPSADTVTRESRHHRARRS